MRRYSLTVICTAVLVVIAAGLFNQRIDPLLMFRFDPANTERLNRIDQFDNVRHFRPQHVERLAPDALVLGTSRSGQVRTTHPAWAEHSGYNMAVPGIRPFEALHYLQHAHAVRPLEKVMLGLDYNSMILPAPRSRPGFDADRLARDAAELTSPGFRIRRFSRDTAALLSLSMLGFSLDAMLGNNPGYRRFHSDGSWESTGNPFLGRAGYTLVARQMYRGNRDRQFSSADNLRHLEALLRFCYRERIDMRLFFTPTHAFFLDLWQRLGTVSLWRSTHRDILALNARLAAEFEREPLPIYGFGAEPGLTDEPILRRRDIAGAWFDDGVHGRPKLGDAVMQRVWGQEKQFGRRLTPDNLESYLDDTDALRESYLENNRDTVAWLRQRAGIPGP